MSTPMENMIAMSRGAQRGRAALAEDSPLEAPVGGFNRHMSLMAPATREMVLKSRTLDIEKFAESRQLNAGAVLGIAEAAMRLGRVPDLRQYGFSGDDAKAIKHFIAGDVLNIAIEQLDAMDTINEAMSDREAAKIVRDLSRAGAVILLKKTESREPGFTKALNCLKDGDLLTIRNMLGENLVALGAAKALIGAMNAAPKTVKDSVQAEATATAGIASYMNLSSNMAHARPRTMVNAERVTRIEDEKTAMKIGPRLGASPFETDVLTLEGIAAKAREADLEAAAAMEAADDIENPTAVSPKGEKVKTKGAKKLRSAGEYEKGQFHPGSHGTAEDVEEAKKPSAKKLRSATEYVPGQFHPGSHGTAEEREIFEQCDLDEAQVRLVKKGPGHFHAVHKKTGKKIGDVKKDGKQWHAKGHSPGPSGRTHDYGASFKSPKRGAKYLSGAWDEQADPIEALADVIINENETLADVIHECFNEAESYDQFFQLVEKYVGFKKLTKEIAAKGGASDPKAVAAAIGRKKYGKKAFQKAAAAGKKMKGMESEETDGEPMVEARPMSVKKRTWAGMSKPQRKLTKAIEKHGMHGESAAGTAKAHLARKQKHLADPSRGRAGRQTRVRSIKGMNPGSSH